MNMKWYWTKIGITAGVIFAVGYAGISIARAARNQVVEVVEGTADVTIPLPFVPFNFDGAKVGTFRKLVMHRAGPKHVSGVNLTVRLADHASLEKFRHCHLTADDPTRVNEHTSFRCVSLDSTMERFGFLDVQTREGGQWVDAATIPLALPVEVAKSIRGEGVESRAAQLELEVDRFRLIGDSLGVLGRALGRASSDAEREDLEEQMGDLREEMEELQADISEAARSRAEEAVAKAMKAAERGVTGATAPKVPPVKPSVPKPQ